MKNIGVILFIVSIIVSLICYKFNYVKGYWVGLFMSGWCADDFYRFVKNEIFRSSR